MIELISKGRYVILLVLVYFAQGFYFNNFYRKLTAERETLTRVQDQDLHVAALYAGEISTGFLTGVELAVEDVNKQSPRVVMTEIALRAFDEDIAVKELNAALRRNLNISAVLADVPPGLAERVAVVCESYGVALVLVNSDPPFLLSRGLKYVVQCEPSYETYCEAVRNNLSALCLKPPGQTLRIGVFFDQSGQGEDTMINNFLGMVRDHNEVYASAQAIREAVEEEVLTGDQTLESLRDNFYLQSGLQVRGPTLTAYLREATLAARQEMRLAQALEEVPQLKHPLRMNFVQGFDAHRLDPARLVQDTKSAPLDCIVVVANLPNSTSLLSHLRSLKVDVPIVVMDYQPEEWVAANLGPLAENLWLLSVYDPDRQTPELDSFRARFRTQAGNRTIKEVDQSAVMAYESLTMLARLVREQGSMAPIDLMTVLGFEGVRWPGLSSDEVGFDSAGQGTGRPMVLLTLQNDRFVSLQRKDNP